LYSNPESKISYAWTEAARNSCNLTELLLTMGEVGSAVEAARKGVEYANISADAQQLWRTPTFLGHALHCAGSFQEAEINFNKASELIKTANGPSGVLYSMTSFYYALLLIDLGKLTRASEVARDGLRIAQKHDMPLFIALDSLSLGRSMHQAWLQDSQSERHQNVELREKAHQYLNAAVVGLRATNMENRIPWGLLARAAFYCDLGEWNKAQDDLFETHEIATRGHMKLFLADYHLVRTRLLLAQISGAVAKKCTLPTCNDEQAVGVSARLFRWVTRLVESTTRSDATAPDKHSGSTRSNFDRPNFDQPNVNTAEVAWQEAAALVKATGFHRRDSELRTLRDTINQLGGVRR
jgi:hypothetical protein